MEKPHHRVLFVPVRNAGSGSTALRVFRRPDGVRTGVAFSSAARLQLTMGGGQEYVLMGVSALRSMLRILGVGEVHVDPELMVTGAPRDRAVS